MAAEAGNPDGQFCHGMQFYNREEYEEAVSWFIKSAEQEEPDAQTQLGICYFERFLPAFFICTSHTNYLPLPFQKKRVFFSKQI